MFAQRRKFVAAQCRFVSFIGIPCSNEKFPVPSGKFPVPGKRIPCSSGLREFACNVLKLLCELTRNRPESPFLPGFFQNSLLISLEFTPWVRHEN
jgi:hypothetical protein